MNETFGETIKQAMSDWDNATEEQRSDALAKSAALARIAELEAALAEQKTFYEDGIRELNALIDSKIVVAESMEEAESRARLIRSEYILQSGKVEVTP